MSDVEKLLEQQHLYYKNTSVLFEILKELKNREFAILNSKYEEKHIATRFLYASNFHYLQMHLRELGILEGKYLINLYRSNALLQPNSIPVSTYNLQKRPNETQEFNDNFANLITGFDLIIDIDGKTIEQSYNVAKEVKIIFDEYQLPYYLKNSGTRGFHFIINANYMPKIPSQELINMVGQALHHLVETYDLQENIDLSTTLPKGLIKCSYSFDGGNVSLPLSEEQFQSFTPELVKVENVLKNIPIMKRGLLIRNWGQSEDKLRSNVKEFLDEFNRKI